MNIPKCFFRTCCFRVLPRNRCPLHCWKLLALKNKMWWKILQITRFLVTRYCAPFWSLACILQWWLSQQHDVRWIICNHIVSEVVVVTCSCKSSICTLNDFDPYPLKGFRPSAVGAKRGGFRPLPRASVLRNQKSGIRSVQPNFSGHSQYRGSYYTRMSGGLESQPLQAIHHTIAF